MEAWPEFWVGAGLENNLVLLELFPVVVAIELWGDECGNLKIRLNCDNMGVVQVINRITASSMPVVRLLRHLVLRCLQWNIFMYAVHIPGVDNRLADALSRFQWDKFRELAPHADKKGVPCPGWMWGIVSESLHHGSGGR